MDIAYLILDYLKVLIWPCVTLMVLFLFRKQIFVAFNRLKSAGLPGGISLNFEQEIQRVVEMSREVKDTEPPADKKQIPTIPLTEANARMISLDLQPSPSGLNLTYYSNLAEQDPNIALAGIRMEMDILTRNLAKGFGIKIDNRDSANTLLKKLYQKSAIGINQFNLAQKMIQLCNRAIHGQPVSREEAYSVIEVAEVLAKQYLSWLSWGFNDGWKPSEIDKV